MKIYAIGYEENVNGTTFYKCFIYKDKFLSTRELISPELYEQLREKFIIPYNKNNGKSGMYFDTI